MLTTLKNPSVTKWTWSGTGFVRKSPGEKQITVPNRRQVYKRARYYGPQTGEFISRDPLEYVDGMSQYRGYLGLSNMDPEGMACSCKFGAFSPNPHPRYTPVVSPTNAGVPYKNGSGTWCDMSKTLTIHFNCDSNCRSVVKTVLVGGGHIGGCKTGTKTVIGCAPANGPPIRLSTSVTFNCTQKMAPNATTCPASIGRCASGIDTIVTTIGGCPIYGAGTGLDKTKGTLKFKKHALVNCSCPFAGRVGANLDAVLCGTTIVNPSCKSSISFNPGGVFK